MNIIVCIKQVPKNLDLQMDLRSKTLLREGAESMVNPLDLVALTEAVRIKKRTGGRITTLTMGPPQAIEALKESMARGADRAILLSDKAFSGADTLATSYTLSRAIISLKIPYDLIFCGLQAIDGDTGQVGPGLAGFLDLPILPNAVKLELDEELKVVTIHRKVDDGLEILKTRLPALIIADYFLAESARVTRKETKAVEHRRIEVYGSKDIGGKSSDYGLAGSATWVERITSPKPVGYSIIDPDLPPQERIRLILAGGVERKEGQAIFRNLPAEEAVDELLLRLIKDGIVVSQE